MGRSGSGESESGSRGGMGGLNEDGEEGGPQRGGPAGDGWDDCSVVGGLCTRQCLALPEAWRGVGLLGKEGRRLGQGEQQGRLGLGGASCRCGG